VGLFKINVSADGRYRLTALRTSWTRLDGNLFVNIVSAIYLDDLTCAMIESIIA